MARSVKSSGIEWLTSEKFETDMKGYSPGGQFTIRLKSGKTLRFENPYKQRNHRHWLVMIHAMCQKERGGLHTTLESIKGILEGSVHVYQEPSTAAISAASVVKTEDLPETLGVSRTNKYTSCKGVAWLDREYFIRDAAREAAGRTDGVLELWPHICDAKGDRESALPVSRGSLKAGALLTVLAVIHNDFMQNLTNRYSVYESAVAESNDVLQKYFKSSLQCYVRVSVK